MRVVCEHTIRRRTAAVKNHKLKLYLYKLYLSLSGKIKFKVINLFLFIMVLYDNLTKMLKNSLFSMVLEMQNLADELE